jgi:protein SCO1/2
MKTLVGFASLAFLASVLAACGATSAPKPAAEGPPPGPYEGSEPPPGIRIPNLRLKSYRGHTVSLRGLEGKVVLVTFLDTGCREKCPIIAAAIGQTMPLLTDAERARIDPLAISVLPQLDTPNRIKSFLRRRHALALDWLNGPIPELAKAWKAFHILAAAQTGNADTHSADIRVFDRNGVWVSTLHAGVDLTPANLAHDIRVALRARG